jgi:ribosomal protein S18 acetylase RimI-like enzyme
MAEVHGPPPPEVLAAFGLPSKGAEPHLFFDPSEKDADTGVDTGQGTTWVAHDCFLKRVGPEEDATEAALAARVCRSIGCLPPADGPLTFRVAEPLVAEDTADEASQQFVAGGWFGFRRLPGKHWRFASESSVQADDAEKLLDAFIDFHETVAVVVPPADVDVTFMAERTHRWAVGDRVAFGEVQLADLGVPLSQDIALVLELCDPADLSFSCQLVHLDFAGNTLRHETLPLGVIDLSLYWCPVLFALGGCVADAVAWNGGNADTLVSAALARGLTTSLLRRAVVFRLATEAIGARDRGGGVQSVYEALSEFAPLLVLCARLDWEHEPQTALRSSLAPADFSPLPAEFQLRGAQPSDHTRVRSVIDSWWGGRSMAGMVPKIFFVYFQDTSFVVEDAAGQLVAFLCGFQSQTDPDDAYIHFAGVAPACRRLGLARHLYETFFRAAAKRGARRCRCVTSVANMPSANFHRCMGFTVGSDFAEAQFTFVRDIQ